LSTNPSREARPIRIFGVGLGKTGTHTLARMFEQACRAGHEVDAERLVPPYASWLRGKPDVDAVRAELRQRAATLQLDVDVAALLAPFAGELATLFPEARFILTIRDCFSWFSSYVEHVVRDPAPVSFWLEARDAGFPRPYEYEPGDEALERRGLPPVRLGFRRWTEGNQGVLTGVPSERLLVVRTEDLSTSIDALASFCRVDRDRMQVVHDGAAPEIECVLADVRSEHLARVARETCAPLMERFWGPSWPDLVSRVGR
jgi:sulfotransferase family protein